jgi:hypothetical protein
MKTEETYKTEFLHFLYEVMPKPNKELRTLGNEVLMKFDKILSEIYASQSPPEMTEEEINDLWNKYCYPDGSVMSYEKFKIMIKHLLSRQPGPPREQEEDHIVESNEKVKEQEPVSDSVIEQEFDNNANIHLDHNPFHGNMSMTKETFVKVVKTLLQSTPKEQKPPTDEQQNHNLWENMQYYMEYCLSNGYVTPQEWIEKYKHF